MRLWRGSSGWVLLSLCLVVSIFCKLVFSLSSVEAETISVTFYEAVASSAFAATGVYFKKFDFIWPLLGSVNSEMS
jgi:hypothetical protein